MVVHSHHHSRLPDGEQPVTEVRANRLDEDGSVPGELTLTPNWIVFLADREHGDHDDYIQHTRFQGAELSGDSDVGELVLNWSDQGKVYEGSAPELRAFTEAIESRLNP